MQTLPHLFVVTLKSHDIHGNGIGYVHLIKIFDLDLDIVHTHYPSRNSHNCSVGRNIRNYHASCPNLYIVSYGDGTQYLSSGTDKDIIADSGMPFSVFFPVPPRVTCW